MLWTFSKQQITFLSRSLSLSLFLIIVATNGGKSFGRAQREGQSDRAALWGDPQASGQAQSPNQQIFREQRPSGPEPQQQQQILQQQKEKIETKRSVTSNSVIKFIWFINLLNYKCSVQLPAMAQCQSAPASRGLIWEPVLPPPHCNIKNERERQLTVSAAARVYHYFLRNAQGREDKQKSPPPFLLTKFLLMA